MPFTMQDIATDLIYPRLSLRNPIVRATIAAQAADINGTPQVAAVAAGATIPAVFVPPQPVQVGGAVWLTRLRPRTGQGIVLWTNYQGGGGVGTGGLGTGPLGQ